MYTSAHILKLEKWNLCAWQCVYVCVCVSKRNVYKSLDQRMTRYVYKEVWCFSICKYLSSVCLKFHRGIRRQKWYCQQLIECVCIYIYDLMLITFSSRQEKPNLQVYWWLSLVSHTLEISIKNVKHLKYCVFMSIFCCLHIYTVFVVIAGVSLWILWHGFGIKNSNERLTTVV